jgi:hypothetical protein
MPTTDFYGETRMWPGVPGAIVPRVFSVDNFSDASNSGTTPGTLRHAITNAQTGDIIRLDNVIPGVTVIELRTGLLIGRSITIEGNGITLTRAASWTTINSVSQFMAISDGTPTIRQVHFKGGRSTNFGGAIFLNLAYLAATK